MGTIKRIRTPAELRAIARSQAGAEVQSQVGPYQSEQRQLVSRRQRALNDMNKLYGGLQDYNKQALGAMGNIQGESGQLQNQAFQQAMTRLDQFRQQRAAEAQSLAQQTGGPVPISAFTEGIDPGNVAQSSAAGALIGAIGGGMDQIGEMGRFTTEVFPLIQQEENKQVRQSFEDKVREVQDQIAQIKGQRGGLVNTKYSDLLAKERDYQLASGALGVNKRQLGLSRQQSINPRTGVPYSVEAATADRLLTEKQQRLANLADNRTQSAYDLLDAWTSPSSEGKTVEVPYQHYDGYFTKANKPKDGYIATDKQGNPMRKLNAAGQPLIQNGQYVYLWYHNDKKMVQVPPGDPKVSDPDVAFKRLRAAGIPKNQAIDAIRSGGYWDVPADWNPGDVKGPKSDESSGLPRPPKPKFTKKGKGKHPRPAGARGPVGTK